MDVKLTNNADQFRAELPKRIEQALIAIGLTAETYAKRDCPVDTGRLRNSITHAYDDDSAYIGTNVEYGKYVELGTSRMAARPYLGPAATQHSQEYKNIAEQALKGD